MKLPPETILVIITRRIGDVFLATAAIRSLKIAWPQCNIHALVFAGTEGVISDNSDIDHIIRIPERPTGMQHLKLLFQIFRRYDLALSLLSGDRPTLYAWLAGKHRAGVLLDRPADRWKTKLLNQYVFSDFISDHTVRTYLSVIRLLNIDTYATLTPAFNATDQAAISTLPIHRHKPLVVLHPYPKYRYKMWQQSNWIALAQWLEQHGYAVAFSGSPDPKELNYIREITAQLPQTVINTAGILSIGGTAALLARAHAYIGPDTAITHLAAATGIPTLALFGPSEPVRWGPWPKGHDGSTNPWVRIGTQQKNNVQLIQGVGDCVPCGFEGCERRLESTSDCLLNISVETVTRCLEDLLQNYTANNQLSISI